jgi:hypothetical protein
LTVPWPQYHRRIQIQSIAVITDKVSAIFRHDFTPLSGGSATLSVTGKYHDGSGDEVSMELTLVSPLIHFAHF